MLTLVYGFRPLYRKRIQKYYSERGLKLLALESTPFAGGNPNLHTAQYMDTEGNDKIIIYNQDHLRSQEKRNL